MTKPLHVCHIVLGLDVGGMENGLVNLIRSLDESAFRHTVISLLGRGHYSAILEKMSVTIMEPERKPAGGHLRYYWNVYCLLKSLKPDIVHTRNLPTCDLAPIARAAGVRTVVHSEHGLDMLELSAKSRRYVWLRRCVRPFVCEYLTLGKELTDWLERRVGVSRGAITPVYNGVDSVAFRPRDAAERATLRAAHLPSGWPGKAIVIGSAGRLSAIKSHDTLIRAVALLRSRSPETFQKLRILLIGDGPMRPALESLAAELDCSDQLHITGFRKDVSDLLATLDVFILSSHREGISNTLLEAMATGLPVIATAVGGNVELVADRRTGLLIEPSKPGALADAISEIVTNPALAATVARTARKATQEHYTWQKMAATYSHVYQRAVDRANGPISTEEPTET